MWEVGRVDGPSRPALGTAGSSEGVPPTVWGDLAGSEVLEEGFRRVL